MTIQQAIEKAIEGGWDKTRALFGLNNASYSMEKVYLDPEFWQALGKSMGWWEQRDGNDCGGCETCDRTFNHSKDYILYWHRFIDHLADGGTIEEFFESLK
mgnify:CR=1 FL=1